MPGEGSFGHIFTMQLEPPKTYWQPRPRAHKPTNNPWNGTSPTTPCHHATYPPRPQQTRTQNTSERSPTTPPRPHRPPPPEGHLRHTGRHPSPHGRRLVLPIYPTRPPSGPHDPPGVDAGEKQRQRVGHGRRPSLGRHLESHHGRLPGSSTRNLPLLARGHQARPPRPPSISQLETRPHHHPPCPRPPSTPTDTRR